MHNAGQLHACGMAQTLNLAAQAEGRASLPHLQVVDTLHAPKAHMRSSQHILRVHLSSNMKMCCWSCRVISL